MVEEIKGYQTVQDFAKQYVKRDGKKGVERAYIYQLIRREMKRPGSTDIDVLKLSDSSYMVRYTRTRVQVREAKA